MSENSNIEVWFDLLRVRRWNNFNIGQYASGLDTRQYNKKFIKIAVKKYTFSFFEQKVYYVVYTLCLKRISRLIFDNNFGKLDQFQNSFISWFVRKFSMSTLQRFLPHLQYAASLPREIWKSKNVNEFLR